MANWTRTLRLNPEWEQCRSDQITRQELAASIARKLNAMRALSDGSAEAERLDLVDTFQAMAEDEDLSEDDFNGSMFDLYEWGDVSLDSAWNGKKVCWVDTISGAP